MFYDFFFFLVLFCFYVDVDIPPLHMLDSHCLFTMSLSFVVSFVLYCHVHVLHVVSTLNKSPSRVNCLCSRSRLTRHVNPNGFLPWCLGLQAPTTPAEVFPDWYFATRQSPTSSAPILASTLSIISGSKQRRWLVDCLSFSSSSFLLSGYR